MGAWWLGYPIIGALILIFAAPLAFFPQRLPKQGTDAHIKDEKKALHERMQMTKDGDRQKFDKNTFLAALKRLLTNKLFVCNFLSAIFYVFGFMGFGTFMPKYIEYQFRKRGSQSSVLAGTVGTVSKAIGILSSGFLVARFRPSARFLSGYNFILGFAYFAFLMVFTFLGCPTSNVYGRVNDGAVNITGACNLACDCPQARLQPICSKDGVTNFYSPCQAGCATKETISYLRPDPFAKEDGKGLSGKKGTEKKPVHIYGDCTCVEEAWKKSNMTLARQWLIHDHMSMYPHPTAEDLERVREQHLTDPIAEAVKGWCPVDCDGIFKTFMACMFVLMVLGSTGRIGSVLVALR